jgi:copper(I)-binding protein
MNLPRIGALTVAAAIVGLAASVAVAHEAKLGSLTLKNLTVKASLKGTRTTGGYVTVVNAGPKGDRLVSVSCTCAAKVEIHRMWMDGDVMRMRLAEHGLEIPAGRTLTLAPGGAHLMLIGVKTPLADKTDVTMTLKFEHAGTVTTKFHVRADPSADMAPMPGMKH